MRKKSKNLVLKGFHWNVDYLKKNSPQKGRISFLSLETEPICNAKCLYCFSGPELGKIPKNSLTLEEYKDIIKQAKELGVKTICFPGIGEPTLDKNLRPLIKFINNLRLVSVIYTNAFISKESADFFYKNNVSLIVKIDSLNKKRFEELVGLPFEVYRKRLDYLINLYKQKIEKKGKSSIVRLAANTVVTHINKEDIKEIDDFCKAYYIKYFVAGLAKVGDAEKNWKILTSGQIDDLYKIVKKYDTWVSSATLDNRCGLFSHGITIDVNGDLIGCPFGCENGACVKPSDVTPPLVIKSEPNGMVNKSDISLKVQTNEDATCKYSTSDINYNNMVSFFKTGEIVHEQTLYLNEGDYNFYVRCKDPKGNINLESYKINFKVELSLNESKSFVDVNTPLIVSASPQGAVTTSKVTLEIITNEPANCRYSSSDEDYSGMTTFFDTGKTTHEQKVELKEGKYTFYIRCEDDSNNVNLESYKLNFEVLSSENPACSGCLIDKDCYPIGFRQDKKYCNSEKEFVAQKEENFACENNFECESNLCINSECVSGNLWAKFLRWLNKIFG